MLSYGLSYGLLSARRRIREMVLPIVTTATGAFLVVLVFGMSAGIQAQSASLGHAEEINRAVVLIAVTVLLVGVVEVAVATTRTVAHRTKELGVLGANGIPRTPVVAALLVEPVVAAVVGAVLGAGLAAVAGVVLQLTGLAATGVSYGGLAGCGDRHRGQCHRRRRGQHCAHVDRGVATTHPILVVRRLTMTAIEDSAPISSAVDTEVALKPVIEISDVWKLHKLGDEVVKALIAAELQVMPGEFVCLMGPSGSGKSTLLNIIGGLDRPTKGTVKIGGRDTGQLTESQFAALRHDSIGFIFQSYNLIPFLSAVENVELPLMFEPYDRKSLRKRRMSGSSAARRPTVPPTTRRCTRSRTATRSPSSATRRSTHRIPITTSLRTTEDRQRHGRLRLLLLRRDAADREPAARDGLFAAGTACQFGHRSGQVVRRRPIRR